MVFAYSDDDEMELHAIVLNAKRRHLDTTSASRAGTRLAELYAKEAQADGNRKRAEAARERPRQPDGTLATSGAPTVARLERGEHSTERAAREVGVSPTTMRQVALEGRALGIGVVPSPGVALLAAMLDAARYCKSGGKTGTEYSARAMERPRNG